MRPDQVVEVQRKFYKMAGMNGELCQEGFVVGSADADPPMSTRTVASDRAQGDAAAAFANLHPKGGRPL